MERQGTIYMLLEASMDVTAVLLQATERQKRFNTLLEQAAKQARQESRRVRGR